MAEEKNKKDEAKSKPQPSKKQEPAVEAQASAPTESKSRHPKVTAMTLAQVETAISDCRKKMGGDQSRHVRSLIAQREVLLRYRDVKPSLRKAA